VRRKQSEEGTHPLLVYAYLGAIPVGAVDRDITEGPDEKASRLNVLKLSVGIGGVRAWD
jgi:hypothetical protein